MLRAQLRDAAIAAAKGYSHDSVGVRHILFAAAKFFRVHPEVAALFPQAKAALGSRGTAVTIPVLEPEAASLLESFVSEEVVLQELRKAYGGPSPAEAVSSKSEAQLNATHSVSASPTPATRAAERVDSLSEVLAELDALIGLEPVKRQLRRVVAVVQANQERTRAGLAPVNTSLHLVFMGPPGTGKTTVARLVARAYAATGALPAGQFVEATRADLVAGFVGQTAIKTAELIERTRPGVLFIDEAYALAPSHGSDFGAEAIATLVKAMEDYRNDFAVIMAGYGNETMDMIRSNPGLRSRFKTYIDFPDYNLDELTAIFGSFASANSMRLAPGAIEQARAALESASSQTDFGNARFARYLFEEAFARMCARAAADGQVELHELTHLAAEDIPAVNGPLPEPRRRIGFGEST